jgi:hypothetical protein
MGSIIEGQAPVKQWQKAFHPSTIPPQPISDILTYPREIPFGFHRAAGQARKKRLSWQRKLQRSMWTGM